MKIYKFTTYGDALRKALDIYGRSQIAFSNKIGISRSQLAHWINNIVTPRKDKVYLINSFLPSNLAIEKIGKEWHLTEVEENSHIDTNQTSDINEETIDHIYEQHYIASRTKLETSILQSLQHLDKALEICYTGINDFDMTVAMGQFPPEHFTTRYYVNIRASYDLLSAALDDLYSKNPSRQPYDAYKYDRQSKAKVYFGSKDKPADKE